MTGTFILILRSTLARVLPQTRYQNIGMQPYRSAHRAASLLVGRKHKKMNALFSIPTVSYSVQRL